MRRKGASVSTNHFSCDHCGRSFKWKPELAGKRAKCSCGHNLSVPESIEEPDLYDVAETGEPQPTAAPLSRVAAPAFNASSSVLSYGSGRTEEQGRFTFDNLHHKPRDFYWPSGTLVAGFLALMVWALVHGGRSPGVLILFSGYITVATVIKTAVMIGAAFVIAPLAGVSFGGVWTAVLKLAAIVVITDAALFWLEDIMVATGAYPATNTGRRSWMWIALINTMLAAAVIGVLLKLFFDMDRDDVASVATPLAVLNRVLNFIILVVLSVLIEAATAAPPPAPVAPAAKPAVPAPPAPKPVNSAVAEKDANIAQQLGQRSTLFPEARSYYETTLGKRHHRDFIDQLYREGAKGVYFGLSGDRGLKPDCIYVELPDAPQARATIVKALCDFMEANRVGGDTLRDQGDRYLTIPLPEWK